MNYKFPPAICFAIACFSVAGCDALSENKRDSWRHYTTGGMYQMGVPDRSSDGTLYFSSPQTNSGDIYLWNEEHEKQKQLTKSPSFESYPCFDENSNRLFFTREDGAGNGNIFSIDLLSSREERVTEGRSYTHAVNALSDGILVAKEYGSVLGHGATSEHWVVRETQKGWSEVKLDGISSTNGSGDKIVLLDRHDLKVLDSHSLAVLTSTSISLMGHPLSLSEDGKYAAVLEAPQNAGSWSFDRLIYRVDTSNGRKLAIDSGHDAVLSFDGKHAIVSVGYGNTLQLWSEGIDDPEVIDATSSFKTRLRVNADGESAIYASSSDNRGSTYGIFQVSFVSSRPLLLYTVNPEKEKVAGQKNNQ